MLNVDDIHDLADSGIAKSILREEIESRSVQCNSRLELLAFAATYGLSGSGFWLTWGDLHDARLPKPSSK